MVLMCGCWVANHDTHTAKTKRLKLKPYCDRYFTRFNRQKPQLFCVYSGFIPLKLGVLADFTHRGLSADIVQFRPLRQGQFESGGCP